MMNKFFTERRTHKRINHESEAEFKILAEDTDLMGLMYRKAKTINISKGGLCLKLGLRLDEGSVVRLEMPMGSDSKTINTFCEVEWCVPASGEFKTGLSFIGLSEDGTEYMDELISNYN